jgi:hypothetical protein
VTRPGPGAPYLLKVYRTAAQALSNWATLDLWRFESPRWAVRSVARTSSRLSGRPSHSDGQAVCMSGLMKEAFLRPHGQRTEDLLGRMSAYARDPAGSLNAPA